jgi:dihydroxyacetone kinase phosphotransfer subunit
MSDGPVGIVVVSHSGAVADAVVELVRQLANLPDSGPRVVAAGGMADGQPGTDAARVATSVRDADQGGGAVILTDLGSSILSAFTAIEELLSPEQAARVRVSGGPLVEGTFVAAVQSAAGDELETVLAAADSAARMDKLGDRR